MLGGEPPHPVGVAGLPAHIDRRVPSGRSVRIPSELAGWVAEVTLMRTGEQTMIFADPAGRKRKNRRGKWD